MTAPALFISHGAPIIAIEDDDYSDALHDVGLQLKKYKAAVVVSAHWESPFPPLLVTSAERNTPINDFSGFPAELSEVNYTPPGLPTLSEHVAGVLSRAGTMCRPDPKRGLDHGVWTPLCRMFPEEDVPIVQLSLPFPRDARMMYQLGKTLKPLREKDVLLIGSGGIVHNLRRAHLAEKDAPVDAWAKEFDDWVKNCLELDDIDKLLDYQKQGPRADSAVQGAEHFDPLFFALGAAGDDVMETIYEGFHYGNLSMRTMAFGL